MSTVYKTTLEEVFSDDMNSPFWRRIDQAARESGFYEEIDHILTQSEKYGKPYADLTDEEKMTKTVFYKKVGRRYKPVSQYDSELMDAYPQGTHLVVCRPGGQTTHFNIDPNYAAMIAAGQVAEDAISRAISEASEIQPPRKPITEAERDAWHHLIAVWGEEARSLTRPATRDIAEAGVRAMQAEAVKLMQHESVRRAFDHFLLTVALTREHTP